MNFSTDFYTFVEIKEFYSYEETEDLIRLLNDYLERKPNIIVLNIHMSQKFDNVAHKTLYCLTAILQTIIKN